MFLASLRRRMPHGLLAGLFLGVSAITALGFSKPGDGEYGQLRLSQAQLGGADPSGPGGGAGGSGAPVASRGQGQRGAGSGGTGGSPSDPADLSPPSQPGAENSLDGPAGPQIVQTLADLSPPETQGPPDLDEAPFNLAGNPGPGSSGGGFFGGGGGGAGGGPGAGGGDAGGEPGGAPGGVPGGGPPPIIPQNPAPTGPVLPPIDQTGPGPEGPNPPYVPGDEAGAGPGPDFPTPPGGQQPPRPTTAVPEPSSWLLLIVGFGGLGASLRARRQRRPASLAGG